ncbi:DUF6009 family protein [Embleya sp. NPDC008237]|uniref:DUF6009 family protein n=1 Tax=Embleya sp. NPDC008237 TaxID=3363978 RepID=UPI0036E00C8D
MSALIGPDRIAHETGIVRLEDPTHLDYISEVLDRLPRRAVVPGFHLPGHPPAGRSRPSGCPSITRARPDSP